ncbi:MAG TPA: peptidase, partial [Polyangiales bacterium]|nr:peptidase [Polyangiales bacterium]
TAARCFESTFNLASASCGGFATGRTFSVNGATATCNGANLVLPAKRNGGYCFQASAGQNSWAWFQTW